MKRFCVKDKKHEYVSFLEATAQPVITCSKLKKETLEQGVKYVQSQPMASF